MKTKKNKISITIRIDEDVYRFIMALAAKEFRSFNNFINSLLRDFFEDFAKGKK